MKKKIFLVLGLFTMGLMSVAFVSTIKTTDLSVLIGNLEAVAANDDAKFMKVRTVETGQKFKVTSVTVTGDAKTDIKEGQISDSDISASGDITIVCSSVDSHKITCPATTVAQTVECIAGDGWVACNTSGCNH